jgi:hypothetical protein
MVRKEVKGGGVVLQALKATSAPFLKSSRSKPVSIARFKNMTEMANCKKQPHCNDEPDQICTWGSCTSDVISFEGLPHEENDRKSSKRQICSDTFVTALEEVILFSAGQDVQQLFSSKK